MVGFRRQQHIYLFISLWSCQRAFDARFRSSKTTQIKHRWSIWIWIWCDTHSSVRELECAWSYLHQTLVCYHSGAQFNQNESISVSITTWSGFRYYAIHIKCIAYSHYLLWSQTNTQNSIVVEIFMHSFMSYTFIRS